MAALFGTDNLEKWMSLKTSIMENYYTIKQHINNAC